MIEKDFSETEKLTKKINLKELEACIKGLIHEESLDPSEGYIE